MNPQAGEVEPPKVPYVSYKKRWKTFSFQLLVGGSKKNGGKLKNGPSRDTQAAAIADRDSIFKLRADGATDAQVLS